MSDLRNVLALEKYPCTRQSLPAACGGKQSRAVRREEGRSPLPSPCVQGEGVGGVSEAQIEPHPEDPRSIDIREWCVLDLGVEGEVGGGGEGDVVEGLETLAMVIDTGERAERGLLEARVVVADAEGVI